MTPLAILLASAAFPCGGTVCDGTTTTTPTTPTTTPTDDPGTDGGGPIVQTGESIVFLQDTDDEWTALVQIETAGEPSGFGWVIPVPNYVDADEVTIADEELMAELEQATAPRFRTDDGTVRNGTSSGCDSGCDAPTVGELVQEAAEELTSAVDLPGVAVVGPYEVASVRGDQMDVLDTWFREGGYDLPLDTWPIIQDYVDDGFSFVILRLLPLQGDLGTVDTIRIPCGQAAPSIPLRLTSIAATRDMAITTYVVANRRFAPPGDWPEVAFDPTGVDPADPVVDYIAQLQSTVAGGGGRGFRTEFAGPIGDLGLSRRTRNELGNGGYITRMKTWASPAAMLTDPEFVPSEAGDLSNVIDLRTEGSTTTTSRRSSVGWLGLAAFALAGLRRRRQG